MSIALGGDQINKAYLGATEIQKMYLGNDLVFDNSIQPSGLTPILTSFNVQDANKDRIYFSTPLGYPDGMKIQGFYVGFNTVDSVTKVDDTSGYFTVGTAFDYWINPIIRLSGGDGTVYDFTQEDVENNIIEPTFSGSTVWVNSEATGANNGTSEADAFTTMQAGLNALTAGNKLCAKAVAGGYPIADHLETNGFGATENNPAWVEGYKVTPGDITSNYYTFTVGQDAPALDPLEMPIVKGPIDKYGLLVEDSNIIFKNIQWQNTAGISSSGYKNLVFERCNSNEQYGSGANASFGGWTMSYDEHGATSFLDQGNMRFLNTNSLNVGMSCFSIKSSGTLIKNCKTYTDQEASNLSPDYHISLAGNYSTVIDTTIEVKNGNVPSSHGFGIKSGTYDDYTGSKSEYNLFKRVYGQTGGNETVQFRNWGADYNVIKDSELVGASDGAGYGIAFQSGARYNIAERVLIRDMSYGVTYKGGTEQGSDPTHQDISFNKIRNCVFDNLTYFMSNFISLDVLTTFEGNKIENCVLKDIGAMNLSAEPTETYMAYLNNDFVNCIFDNINTGDGNASYPRLADMFGFDTDVFNGPGTWSSSVPPTATNSFLADPELDANYKPSNEALSDGLVIAGIDYDYDNNERNKTLTTIGSVILDSEEIGGGTPPVSEIDYYVSTSGTGTGVGTEVDPFVFSQLASADLQDKVVGFKGGDEFYEYFTKNYASNLNVTFTSYDGQATFKGTKPITGFSVHSGNVYVADTVDTIYHVAIGEDLQTNARLPKIVSDRDTIDNYYPITTTISNTSFISTDMIGIPSLVGANCFVKDYAYSVTQREITGHNTTTGEITIDSTIIGLGTADYFFVNNHLSLVTTDGDWFWDAVDKLYIYSAPAPTNIEALTLNEVAFHLEGTNGTKFDNIKFLGYNNNTIDLGGTTGTEIINCLFKNSQDQTIRGASVTTTLIDNCTFNNGLSVACYISGLGTVYTTFTNNNINNTGLLSQLSYHGYKDGAGSASIIFNGDATDNTITNCGYNGMAFYGSGICERNVITDPLMASHDGGGIYTYNHPNYSAIGQRIRNNTITTTLVPSGTWSNYGIYCDDNSTDMFVTSNIISGFSSNVFLHNTQRNEVTLNELSLARSSGLLMKNDDIAADFLDNVIEQNTIAQESATAMCFRITNNSNSTYGLASIDNNTYSNTLSANCVQLFTTTDDSLNTLEEWRAKSGMDANSTFNNGGSETELLTNPDFTDGSNGWAGGNWTIGDGTADYNGVAYQDILFQNNVVTAGNEYKFDADVLSGTVRVRAGDASWQTYSGTTLIFVNTAGTDLSIQSISDTASLNSVSLKDN